MRLEITLEGKESLTLPLHYNGVLQAFVYRLLGDIAQKIHDEGFGEYRRFKMFVFSELFGETEKVTGREIKFRSPVKFYLASPYSFVIHAIFDTLLRKYPPPRLREFHVSSVNIQEFHPGSETLTVRTLSPITAYQTFRDSEGKNKTMYFSPAEWEFVDLLEKNLRRKYKILHNEEYDGNLDIRPLKSDCLRDYRLIIYKKTLIKAWHGEFQIKASPDMLKVALYSGLGPKNSQGFGMLKEI